MSRATRALSGNRCSVNKTVRRRLAGCLFFFFYDGYREREKNLCRLGRGKSAYKEPKRRRVDYNKIFSSVVSEAPGAIIVSSCLRFSSCRLAIHGSTHT